MALENILPHEDGMYRYVVFRLEEQEKYFISAQPYGQSNHLTIANDFGKQQKNEKFLIVGGGILNYNTKENKIIFHVGCRFGPSIEDKERIEKFRKTIDSAMKDSKFKYEIPLDEANEPITFRRNSFDPFSHGHIL
jgi:acetylornithine deacetylase/succinyl-diaminopimelate desuccinylase-like protein